MEIIRDFICPDATNLLTFSNIRLKFVSPIPIMTGYQLNTYQQYTAKKNLRDVLHPIAIGSFSSRVEYGHNNSSILGQVQI